MMSVDAILSLAVLAQGARIQPGQKRNGVELVRRRLIIVHKRAAVALAARSSQEVVVADLVIILTSLHCFENGLDDRDRLVQTPSARIPLGLGGCLLLGTLRRDISGARSQRHRDLRWWTGGFDLLGYSLGKRGEG